MLKYEQLLNTTMLIVLSANDTSDVEWVLLTLV